MTNSCSRKQTSPRYQRGQCHVVDQGLIFWRNPPQSLNAVVRYSQLPQKDALLLLDFFSDGPFTGWKAVTLNTGSVIYTTTDNIAIVKDSTAT